MQSSPELIRYSVMPLLRLQYNAHVQESNLEETDQGLNLAVLILEKFHVSLSLFPHLLDKKNTVTAKMWEGANDSIFKGC